MHTKEFLIGSHLCMGFITSYFTYFSHGISYWILWNIPSKNAEAVSQGFYMVISTWYFKFLWNNMWKTMWNPCKTLSKFHILFTSNSDNFHRAFPSSELEVWIVQLPSQEIQTKRKLLIHVLCYYFQVYPF